MTWYLEQKLLGEDQSPSGTVRLATSDGFAAWFVIPRLPLLLARHPGLTLEVVTGNQAVSLARREADISLRLTKPTQPNLHARRVGTAGWAVYASERYLEARGVPKLRNQFAGHDVVGFDEELKGTLGARWLAAHASAGRTVFRGNSVVSSAAAVSAGLGVGAAPCVFGDVQPNLRRVMPNVIGHHDIWLVVHPDVKTSARVRAVLDALAALVQDELLLLLLQGQSGRPFAAGPKRSSSRRR